MPTPLTPQQVKFFQTFGYLHLPGLVRDRIDEITRAFHEVWERKGHVHSGAQRSALVPFIDRHEVLSALLDDPRIEGLAGSLLGEDFNYLTSDGNYYVGDTNWHCDSFHDDLTYLKIAFYLDPVKRDSGALRIIPGTHLVDRYREALGPLVQRSREELGVHGRDVPAAALESEPGDVVCFNHTCLHASFGGSNRRRMFTIDTCQRHPEARIQELREYLAIFGRKGMERMYGPTMLATAGSGRRRHLEQVMANDGLMAELARAAHTAGTASYALV
jgi:hypothetical protein